MTRGSGGGPAAQSRPSIRKNVAYSAIKTLSTIVFPMVTFPYVSRTLGPEGVGKINFAFSYVQYFVLMASLGIPFYGIRAVASARDDATKIRKITTELLVIHAISAVLVGLVLVSTMVWVGEIHKEILLFGLVALTMPSAVVGAEWFFQGKEDYAFITKRAVFFSTLSLVATFVFVRDQSDYILSAAIAVFANVGIAVSGAARILPEIWGPPMRLELRPHLKPLAKVFALNASVGLYLNLDTVLLGFLGTKESVGYYSAAMRVTKMVLALMAPLGSVLIPRMAYLAGQGREGEFLAMQKRSFSVMLLLCIPSAVGLALLSPGIISLLAGGRFASSAACMMITAPIIPLIGVTTVINMQILYPKGHDWAVVGCVLFGALVSVGANVLLIPKFQHMGTAASALAAEFCVLLAAFAYVRRTNFFAFPWPVLARTTISSTFMGALIYFLPTQGWLRLVVAMPLGVVAYSAMLLLTREPMLMHLLNTLGRSRSDRI